MCLLTWMYLDSLTHKIKVSIGLLVEITHRMIDNVELLIKAIAVSYLNFYFSSVSALLLFLPLEFSFLLPLLIVILSHCCAIAIIAVLDPRNRLKSHFIWGGSTVCW